MNPSLVKRLTGAIAAAAAVVGLAASVSVAEAQQSRFRVLVPNLEPREGARKNFGEDVAKELRNLIDDMATHAAVEDRALRDALRKYDLKADELSCIQWRQLAVQMNVELVMCGSYQDAGGMQISAEFQGAKTGEPFEVPQFSQGDAKQAAQQIFQAFEGYVNQLRLASFCLDYVNSQQWDNALSTCDEALQLNPNSVTALYGRAEALMRKAESLEDNGSGAGPSALGGDSAVVPETAPDAITDQPAQTEHSAEYVSLMEQALEGFDQVLEVNPIHEDALVAAGYVAAKLDRPEQAREYYTRLIELDPGNTDVRLQLAVDLARAGDPAGALQLAEEGLGTAPDNITLKEYSGHFALGAATKAAADGDPEANALFGKALDYYRQVFDAKADEADPTMLRNMLATLNQLERYDEAVELGGRMVQAKRDAGIWMAYGEALKNADQLDQALAALDSVAAIEPTTPRLATRRGQWLLEADDMAGARQALEQAVQQGEITQDQAADVVFGYGYTQRYQQGQQDAAMEYFTAAKELAESPALKARSDFFNGYVLLQRGQRVQEPGTAASAREALPIFQRSLQHLQAASAYAEQAENRARLIDAVQQFIEVQEALIKRGR